MIAEFIQQMPKAEIHIHLEGAIQPHTVLRLAEKNGMMDTLPSDQLADLQKWFTFVDFPHFVKIYLTISNLLRSADDFSLIAYECGADMAAQNIRYREVTVTPFTHTDVQDKGLAIEDVLSGLENGRLRAREDFGVEMRWVFDCPRNQSFDDGIYKPTPAQKTLRYTLQGRDYGVVGFGLGGYEVGAPPEPFAHAFDIARAEGLLCVPHAGETMGADSVWGAVNQLQADRIGHGVRAIEDPELLTLLKERQIPLEINPVSNQKLGVFPDIASHPFRQLDEMGLFVTVNSDDPPLFNTTLNNEYLVLAELFDYDQANLIRIARNAYLASGVESVTKQTLLQAFDNWAASAVPATK
ncbi:MAG: adenosine deaminase [Chloroflexota bacterium]